MRIFLSSAGRSIELRLTRLPSADVQRPATCSVRSIYQRYILSDDPSYFLFSCSADTSLTRNFISFHSHDDDQIGRRRTRTWWVLGRGRETICSHLTPTSFPGKGTAYFEPSADWLTEGDGRPGEGLAPRWPTYGWPKVAVVAGERDEEGEGVRVREECCVLLQ